mgnify:CR=1 FL=1
MHTWYSLSFIKIPEPCCQFFRLVSIVPIKLDMLQTLITSRIVKSDVKIKGHAIECRINAEDPKTFVPSPGEIVQFHPPSGLGIRVEACVYSGYIVPPYYDSLIAKLIVHGDNRSHCILRLKQALKEIVIEPISTTIELHKGILDTKVMGEGSYDIRWLETKLLDSK